MSTADDADVTARRRSRASAAAPSRPVHGSSSTTRPDRVGEGLRQADLLGVAGGQLGHRALEGTAEAQLLQHPLPLPRGDRPDGGGEASAVDGGHVPQIGPHRQPRRRRERGREVAHGGRPVHHPPRRRRGAPRRDTQQRRLPRPVGPHHHHRSTRSHHEVNPAEHLTGPPVALGHPHQLDHPGIVPRAITSPNSGLGASRPRRKTSFADDHEHVDVPAGRACRKACRESTSANPRLAPTAGAG